MLSTSLLHALDGTYHLLNGIFAGIGIGVLLKWLLPPENKRTVAWVLVIGISIIALLNVLHISLTFELMGLCHHG